MSKKRRNDGIVFSTDPDYAPWEEEREEEEALPPHQQTLYISINRKLKGGKKATIISNFIGPEAALKELGKELKAHCGAGGAVKDGEIIVQGEFRDKIAEYLRKRQYKVKYKGG